MGISGDAWEEGSHGDAGLPLHEPERTGFHRRESAIQSTTWFLEKQIHQLFTFNKENG